MHQGGAKVMAVRSVVVDPDAPGRLVIKDVPDPAPAASDAVVRVSAISLNPGELKRASAAAAGWRPGWDFAGTVEQAAADGSGPAVGSRVVGLLPNGAWSEKVAIRSDWLAALPDSVTDAQAATLPVAGLTALLALEKGGSLVERPVLITGASGGVGLFGCQIARHAGARVVAVVRNAARVQIAKDAGAHEVVVSEDASGAAEFGPYHLVLESIGGKVLTNVMTMLAQGGTCVTFGGSVGGEAVLDPRKLFPVGGASVYGLTMFYELRTRGAGYYLARLLRMVADGTLRPQIEAEAPWSKVADLAQQYLDRQIPGKVVLNLSD
jgi:NADPH:quinone reductase-like Zn-dependent oxidoreductase